MESLQVLVFPLELIAEFPICLVRYRKLRRELNLDPMDLKSNHAAPVLTDPTPLSKSRLGVPSSLLQYSPPGAAFSAGLFLTIPRRKAGLLDDVRSNSWLDAMKSSSPPHRKITKDVNNEPVANEADIAYHTWMVIIFFYLCVSTLIGFGKFLSYLCSTPHLSV